MSGVEIGKDIGYMRAQIEIGMGRLNNLEKLAQQQAQVIAQQKTQIEALTNSFGALSKDQAGLKLAVKESMEKDDPAPLAKALNGSGDDVIAVEPKDFNPL